MSDQLTTTTLLDIVNKARLPGGPLYQPTIRELIDERLSAYGKVRIPTRSELYTQAKSAGLAVKWSGPGADDWNSLWRKLHK